MRGCSGGTLGGNLREVNVDVSIPREKIGISSRYDALVGSGQPKITRHLSNVDICTRRSLIKRFLV